MKTPMIFASLALLAAGLTSCSMAEGLVKTASRTTGSLSRTVGNLGSAIGR